MPTRLLLIRHADSQHKVEGITGGPLSCLGLTEKGRGQAACLRDRLAHDERFTSPVPLYASVVPRAVETANILAESLGAGEETVSRDCGLCSWHIPPEWDGLPWEEVNRRFAAPGGGVFRPFEAGAESWAGLVARVGRALYGIAQRHRDETALVVAHKETIQASLIALGALPLMLPFEGSVANASITEWTTEGDPYAWPSPRWTLVRFNDAAHLAAFAPEVTGTDSEKQEVISCV
jgi:probable phosphoglycerate mutase